MAFTIRNTDNKIKRIPRHVDLNEHKKGSLIFFSSNLGSGKEGEPLGPTEDQRFIRNLMQIIPGKDYGRNWITHVAIICDIKKKDDIKIPIIAHATEKGNENAHKEKIKQGILKQGDVDPDYVIGYVKEPLQEQVERDQDRAFISFSPNGESLYKKIEIFFGKDFCIRHNITPENAEKDLARHIGDNANADTAPHLNLDKVRWTMKAGAKAFFHRSSLNPFREVSVGELKTQAQSTICSEFGAKALKIGSINYFEELYLAAQDDVRKGLKVNPNLNTKIPFKELKVNAACIPGYIHIQSNSTPKSLHNHLYQHSDYQMECYLGKCPLERLNKCLQAMIVKTLENPKLSFKERNEAKNVNFILKSELAKVEQTDNHSVNQAELCIGLLNKILPEIKKINQSTYKQAIEISNGIGIDKKDIKLNSDLNQPEPVSSIKPKY